MTKTKNDAIELARNAARTDATANAMTVEQIEAMTYDARRDLSMKLSRDRVTTIVGLADRFRADFLVAYENALQTMWASKARARENARRNFKTACSGLSPEQANARVAEIVTSFNLRGARVGDNGVEVVRGARLGARLSWRFERDDDEVVNPDDAKQRAWRYRVRLEFGTSGTTCTSADMAVYHGIHADLLAVATEVESALSAERIVSTWGVPQAVEEGAL